MVELKAFHVTRIQKTQTKLPVELPVSDTNHQIGNSDMFFIQLRLVAIAAFSVKSDWQAKCMLTRRLRTSIQVPAAFTGRAAPLFCHGPHNNSRFKPLFGIHQFEATVFVFQLPQGGPSWRRPSRQTVNASHRTGIVHSMLAAQFCHRHSDSTCFWMARVLSVCKT